MPSQTLFLLKTGSSNNLLFLHCQCKQQTWDAKTENSPSRENPAISPNVNRMKAGKVAELLDLNPLTICRPLKQFHKRDSVENEPRSMSVCSRSDRWGSLKKKTEKNFIRHYWGINRSVPKTFPVWINQRELRRLKYWRRTVAKILKWWK